MVSVSSLHLTYARGRAPSGVQEASPSSNSTLNVSEGVCALYARAQPTRWEMRGSDRRWGGGEGVFSRRFALKRRREGEKKNNSCGIPFVRLCGSDEETDADLHLDFGMTTPRGNK